MLSPRFHSARRRSHRRFGGRGDPEVIVRRRPEAVARPRRAGTGSNGPGNVKGLGRRRGDPVDADLCPAGVDLSKDDAWA